MDFNENDCDNDVCFFRELLQDMVVVHNICLAAKSGLWHGYVWPEQSATSHIRYSKVGWFACQAWRQRVFGATTQRRFAHWQLPSLGVVDTSHSIRAASCCSTNIDVCFVGHLMALHVPGNHWTFGFIHMKDF